MKRVMRKHSYANLLQCPLPSPSPHVLMFPGFHAQHLSFTVYIYLRLRSQATSGLLDISISVSCRKFKLLIRVPHLTLLNQSSFYALSFTKGHHHSFTQWLKSKQSAGSFSNTFFPYFLHLRLLHSRNFIPFSTF